MLRQVLFSLLVLLALSAEAHATGELQLLAGIKAVNVVIEDLPPDAATCGVSQEMLRSTAILVLKKNTTLSIDKNALPYVYVNLTVLRVGRNVNWCTAFLSVEYKTYEDVQQGDRLIPFVGMAIWSKGTLLLNDFMSFPNAVKSALTDFLEEFSAAWLMQNQNTSTSAPPPSVTFGSAP